MEEIDMIIKLKPESVGDAEQGGLADKFKEALSVIPGSTTSLAASRCDSTNHHGVGRIRH
jgi:hypothetical protein